MNAPNFADLDAVARADTLRPLPPPSTLLLAALLASVVRGCS